MSLNPKQEKDKCRENNYFPIFSKIDFAIEKQKYQHTNPQKGDDTS